MKKYVILLFAIISISGLAIANTVVNQQLKDIDKDINQKYDINATITAVSGDIFTGNYLRIGINNGGAFGVIDNSGIRTSLQSSIYGSDTDSIYADGYNFAYQKGTENKIAYWDRLLGIPPWPTSNINIISNSILTNDNEKIVKKTVVKTTDGALMMNFTFTFMKRYSNVNLDTVITNIGTTTLKNIVYKRVVDVDICGSNNAWVSDSNSAFARVPDVYVIVTSYCSEKKPKITVAGIGPVSYVDLNRDDRYAIGSGNTVQDRSYVIGDYAALIHYNIGSLSPKQSKTVATSYQASFPP